jgi:hypothetical protein
MAASLRAELTLLEGAETLSLLPVPTPSPPELKCKDQEGPLEAGANNSGYANSKELRKKRQLMQRKMMVMSVMTLLFLASLAAFGAAGEKAKVKGMIVSRTGETLIVNSPDGKVTVVLTDETRTLH